MGDKPGPPDNWVKDSKSSVSTFNANGQMKAEFLTKAKSPLMERISGMLNRQRGAKDEVK